VSREKYRGPERRQRQWHEDRRTTLSIIIALFVQAGSIIWWASGIEHRMRALETDRHRMRQYIESTIRIEAMLKSVNQRLSRIEAMLDQREGPR